MDFGEINSAQFKVKREIKDELKRVNNEQKKILVEFLEKHPELKSGKFSATFTKKLSTRLWMDVSTILNAVPCAANKTHDQWKKVGFFVNLTIDEN